MLENTFHEQSYKNHEQGFTEYARGGKMATVAQSWFNENTLNYIGIKERNEIINPLLKAYQESQWLTVGDGRYGSDAAYIQSKGFDVTATDISDILLKEGLELGIISKYKKENSENLSFSNNEFDFALCKEAYHHFPRPMKALYEMLRVSKQGIVLLEPVDQYIYSNFIQMLFRKSLHLMNFLGLFKLLTGTKLKRHTYEDVGNYVYKLSVREVEKVALGLNYPTIAYKKMNTIYLKGMENTPANKFTLLKLKTKLITLTINTLSTIGIIEPALMSFIIFKNKPTPEALIQLKAANYRVINLPQNPYIK